MSSLHNLNLAGFAFLGALGALLFCFYCQRLDRKKRHQTAAIALIVAALIYVVATLFSEGTGRTVELVGLLVFGVLAVGGLRRPIFLVIGWTAHPLWDLLLHPILLGGPSPIEISLIVPTWYPAACVGFDLLLAGYLAADLLARHPDRRTESGQKIPQ